MSTEFVIDPDRLEEFLPMLGKTVEDGYIVDIETGEIATSPAGEERSLAYWVFQSRSGFLCHCDGEG